jgi:flagellar biosynthesis protein FlhF
MQIKRFEAKNMTTALRLIKDELGLDAVILSARSLRKGRGFFGSMKYAGVEVTAAIDNHRLLMQNSNSADRKSIYPNWERTRFRDPYRVEKREVIRATGYPGQDPVERQRYHPERRRVSGRNDKALSAIYQQILAQEVDRSIASELIEEIQHIPAPLENLDRKGLRSHLTSILEELGVMVDRDVFAAGSSRMVAFVGSTGVGKTTTIAKLAALQSRRFKKRVALITLDNYGISAMEQLKTYAQIIGIPLETAVNFAELKRSIKKYKDKELIIIDTPGINPHNFRLIQDLKGYFAKLSDLQTHLVLSATTKEKDLIGITEAFKEMNIRRLLFTKIDESTTYGNIINLLIRTKIPLSFLGSGRKVPDDIEAGSTEKLVDLLFNSKSVLTRKAAVSSHIPDSQAVDHDNLPTVRTHFVTNKNSDLYHCSDCKWTKKNKPDHMIKFSSAQEAEAQNLLPCSICKPDRLKYGNHLDPRTEKIKLSSYL